MRDKDNGADHKMLLGKNDLTRQFHSVVTKLAEGEIARLDVLTVSRDGFGRMYAHSDLAPIESYDQHVLESAFDDFIHELTDEYPRTLLRSTLENPDHTAREYYYDRLESAFGIPNVNTDIQVVVRIMADDRGIVNATWSLEKPNSMKRSPFRTAAAVIGGWFSHR